MKKIWSFLRGYWSTADRWLLFLWLSASAVSALFLYGIYNSGMTGGSRIITQAGASGLGLGAALVMSLFDYRSLLKCWKLALPLCLIGVGLTFFVGVVRGDNQAWLIFSVAGRYISIQPSEFLKVVMIMTLSLHINHVKDSLNRLSNVTALCLHGGAYVLLIQFQGDSGSASVFLIIFLFMIFFAGIAWRYILTAAALAVPAVVVLWFKVLTPDQQLRFLAVYSDALAPEIYDKMIYQQMRGLLAMGVGGMQGTGILTGKHVWVPEVYNDFILSFIGEATGLIGCLGVIALLLAICLKLLYNSSIAVDDTGRLVCVGMFAWLASQTVINIGMCVKLMPVIGVTLPLISAGGSSVLALYLGLGLVLSVYRHSTRGLFHSET